MIFALPAPATVISKQTGDARIFKINAQETYVINDRVWRFYGVELTTVKKTAYVPYATIDVLLYSGQLSKRDFRYFISIATIPTVKRDSKKEEINRAVTPRRISEYPTILLRRVNSIFYSVFDDFGLFVALITVRHDDQRTNKRRRDVV